MSGCWLVIARAAPRVTLFDARDDYRLFLDVFSRALRASGCAVHAFALVPTHYELVLRGDARAVGRCLHATNRPFSRERNRRCASRGPCFEPPLRFPLRAHYWLDIARAFVHLAPVRARVARSPERYLWSSCGPTLGEAPSPFRLASRDGRAHRALLRRSPPLPPGTAAPTATQVATFLSRALVRDVRERGPRIPGVRAATLAACLGRRAGLPMRTLARVCGLHDANTAHVLTWRLRRRLASERDLAARVRRWCDRLGLDPL